MERFREETMSTTLTERYPGYPAERFVATINPETPLQGIEIPDGQWTLNNAPLPSFEQSLVFIDAGYQTDSIGRPLHPWAHTLLSEEHGGVVTGKGAYWNWGPNPTADPIVLTTEARPRILLIQRSDTGILALPGGFVDGGEDPYDTARRELQEETGLDIAVAGQLVYDGPVADLRATLHAWPETSAYVFHVDAPQVVTGADDALNADWYYVDELSDQLFGSHAMLVERALETLENQTPLSFEAVLALPDHQRTTTLLQAGHMAYRHYTTEHKDIRIFVKEHDASQFTDPLREAHSRAYLVKEQGVYAHLAEHGFLTIPNKVELIEDSVLAMDLLAPESGWHWRAPEAHLSTYTAAVLAAFDTLQQTTPFATDRYHEAVAPTYETFWREGWDAIDDATLEVIREKITELSSPWSKEQRQAASYLSNELATLREHAQGLNREVALFPAHNDARQSNIAWHPDYGVKLVDWSWADEAPKDADATMFLIDLAKSGHPIEAYRHKINHDYALTLIGFWLAHSTWETRDGNVKVREHQVASATAAFQLIQSLPQSALVFSENL